MFSPGVEWRQWWRIIESSWRRRAWPTDFTWRHRWSLRCPPASHSSVNRRVFRLVHRLHFGSCLSWQIGRLDWSCILLLNGWLIRLLRSFRALRQLPWRRNQLASWRGRRLSPSTNRDWVRSGCAWIVRLSRVCWKHLRSMPVIILGWVQSALYCRPRWNRRM